MIKWDYMALNLEDPLMSRKLPNRWPDWALGLYCLGSIVVGFLGLGIPVPGMMADEVGTFWSQIYSLLLIIGGAVALAGILIRVRRATVWSIVGLSFATLIHGISVMSSGYWQTGLRLVIAPLMMIPAIIGWNFWMTWRSLQRETGTEK